MSAPSPLSRINWVQPVDVRTDGRAVAAELRLLLAGRPVTVHRDGPRGLTVTYPSGWPWRRTDGLAAFVAALLPPWWNVRLCGFGIVARFPLAGTAKVRSTMGEL